MISSEGENLQLKSPVEITGSAEKWLSSLVDEMKATIRHLCGQSVAPIGNQKFNQ